MNIFSLLPALPWEGPPFPRFLGIFWTTLFQQGGGKSLALPFPTEFIKSLGESSPNPSTLYSNLEEIEFPNGFDPDTFMPKRIVIHRKTETR